MSALGETCVALRPNASVAGAETGGGKAGIAGATRTGAVGGCVSRGRVV